MVLNLLVYFGTRLIPRFIPFTDCTLPLDALVPFVPEMIVIYILSYIFWIVNYIIIVSESHENCKFVLTGEMIAKLICLLCFILVPTQITRPDPEGSGIFVSLTRLIYALDEPNNLLPSIHVLESWFCWRGLRDCKRVSGFYKVFSLIFFIAVCISTVTVRQHVLVDIPAGIIAGELGLALSGLIYKKKRNSP